MDLKVIEYSGCCYAHEPREFHVGGERHQVAKVLDTRLEQVLGGDGATRQVWRVANEAGEVFRLTYCWTSDLWSLERD